MFNWAETAMELIGGLAEPASFATLYSDIEALQAYLAVPSISTGRAARAT